MKKRKGHRHPLSLSFQVIPAENQNPFEIHSVDFSTDGLSFLASNPLKINSHVHVRIPVENVTELDTQARVAYSKEDLETGLFQTGLEFDDKSKSFHRILKEKLEEIKTSSAHLEEDLKDFEAEIRAEFEKS